MFDEVRARMAAYIGGHPAFTEKKKVYVFAYHNRLVIQPLDLVIPIADITRFSL
jgi:hypothetical protein